MEAAVAQKYRLSSITMYEVRHFFILKGKPQVPAPFVLASKEALGSSRATCAQRMCNKVVKGPYSLHTNLNTTDSKTNVCKDAPQGKENNAPPESWEERLLPLPFLPLSAAPKRC